MRSHPSQSFPSVAALPFTVTAPFAAAVRTRLATGKRGPIFLVAIAIAAMVVSGAWAAAPANLSVPDSQPARDPFLSPPPGAAVQDSAAPMQAAVKLSTQGAFTSQAARVGDSLDYVVSVEWEDTQVPVMVLAPDSVEFPGFKILGQATQHSKLANGQTVRNHTDFIYKLRAASQGPGKAASLKVRYLSGLSQREEAVFVPSALIDIGPAPVRLLDMLWFKLLLWIAILAAAVAAGWASFRLAARKRMEARPRRADLRPQVDALKSRLRTVQNNAEASKAVLMEMEAIATAFLLEELGETKPASETKPARFESLADAYLSKGGGGATGREAADWAKLKELFRHARFAGGYKEPHELQDAFKTFRKCLKMQTEDEL
jgi:hypothetical protein